MSRRYQAQPTDELIARSTRSCGAGSTTSGSGTRAGAWPLCGGGSSGGYGAHDAGEEWSELGWKRWSTASLYDTLGLSADYRVRHLSRPERLPADTSRDP